MDSISNTNRFDVLLCIREKTGEVARNPDAPRLKAVCQKDGKPVTQELALFLVCLAAEQWLEANPDHREAARVREALAVTCYQSWNQRPRPAKKPETLKEAIEKGRADYMRVTGQEPEL